MSFPIKLPILMYHKIDPSRSDTLTVSINEFDAQMSYLKENSFSCAFFKELPTLSTRPIIITFDDAYDSFYEYAYPILKKYNMKATVFLPAQHLGKTNTWDNTNEPIMSIDQLRSLDEHIVEFGIHSFSHTNLATLSEEAVSRDTQMAFSVLEEAGLPFTPVYAYPYGKRPRNQGLLGHGIYYGVRIGNRMNRYPFQDNMDINRMDIQGGIPMWRFKLMLTIGNKLFSVIGNQ